MPQLHMPQLVEEMQKTAPLVGQATPLVPAPADGETGATEGEEGAATAEVAATGVVGTGATAVEKEVATAAEDAPGAKMPPGLLLGLAIAWEEAGAEATAVPEAAPPVGAAGEPRFPAPAPILVTVSQAPPRALP